MFHMDDLQVGIHGITSLLITFGVANDLSVCENLPNGSMIIS